MFRMSKTLQVLALAGITGAALLATPAPAQADGFSLGFFFGGRRPAAQIIIAAPAPIWVTPVAPPAPVYGPPAPVYTPVYTPVYVAPVYSYPTCAPAPVIVPQPRWFDHRWPDGRWDREHPEFRR